MGYEKHPCSRGRGEKKPGSARAFLATLVLGLVAIGAMASSAFALSPAVATQPASSLAETGATLNGLVNPNGSETKIYFEYGTTTSYGSKTTEVSAGSGSVAIEKSQPISGLKANTVYHYRIVATNAFGASQGVDQTFNTFGPPEGNTWVGDPHASGEGATLTAFIDPNGQSTTYYFEYGTKSGTYTNTTTPESAGSGMTQKTVSTTITGLMPGTTYYYRVIASNAGGKLTGAEFPYYSQHPGISYLAPEEVLSKEATLRAEVDTHGLSAKYYFEYGTTTSYGNKVPLTAKEINEAEEPKVITVSEVATGLKAGTLYHYRLVAENAKGTTQGTDQTFTTQPAVTLRYKGGGESLAFGAPLKAFSSHLTFTNGGGSKRKCTETEFSGEVTENPGALQTVGTKKMQESGGAGCVYLTWYNIKYSIPGKEITLRYDTNGSQGIARLSEFLLVGTVYFGATEIGKCEYNLKLSGTYGLKAPIEKMTLSGNTEPVSLGSEACPGAETVSGDFAVTSGGTLVETK